MPNSEENWIFWDFVNEGTESIAGKYSLPGEFGGFFLKEGDRNRPYFDEEQAKKICATLVHLNPQYSWEKNDFGFWLNGHNIAPPRQVVIHQLVPSSLKARVQAVLLQTSPQLQRTSLFYPLLDNWRMAEAY